MFSELSLDFLSLYTNSMELLLLSLHTPILHTTLSLTLIYITTYTKNPTSLTQHYHSLTYISNSAHTRIILNSRHALFVFCCFFISVFILLIERFIFLIRYFLVLVVIVLIFLIFSGLLVNCVLFFILLHFLNIIYILLFILYFIIRT